MSVLRQPHGNATMRWRPRASVTMIVAVAVAVLAAGCGDREAAEATNADRTGSTAPPPGKPPGERSDVTSTTAEQDDPSAMVCNDETRTNVANQLTRGELTGDPTMVRSGSTARCTYLMSGGSLVMTVHQSSSDAAASEEFAQLRDAEPSTAVRLLGAEAFTRADGTTVTRKDDMVLTVDVTKLPDGNDRIQIAQSLSFEILACWTG